MLLIFNEVNTDPLFSETSETKTIVVLWTLSNTISGLNL
jgi:hypothetical protein